MILMPCKWLKRIKANISICEFSVVVVPTMCPIPQCLVNFWVIQSLQTPYSKKYGAYMWHLSVNQKAAFMQVVKYVLEQAEFMISAKVTTGYIKRTLKAWHGIQLLLLINYCLLGLIYIVLIKILLDNTGFMNQKDSRYHKHIIYCRVTRAS